MNESISPVELAKRSMEYYLRNGRYLPSPDSLNSLLGSKAGAFVSLKKHGRLRGCIGTILPTQPNLAAEIITNAVSASTHDPRFNPVTADELAELDISVDVLSEPEPVAGFNQLDPKRYGVIVRKGRHSGLLLPDLEGVDTVEQQVSIACQKAGLSADEQDIQLFRFSVTRYYE